MVWYIIDGYNLINKIEEIQAKELKKKREYLINLLINKMPHGKNKITIIFDGKYEIYSSNKQNLKEYGIEVIFTNFETADDKIKKLVERSNNPKEIIVITDDREIQYYVRYYGCKIVTAVDFLNKLKPKPNNNQPSENKTLSIEEEDNINKEIKKMYKLE